MKLKSILLTAVITLSLATATIAQVPNYLPTNGLVGWWPFNGNANDESGNGLNGIVVDAVLSDDRLNNMNSAYAFQSDIQCCPYIQTLSNLNFNQNELAGSFWFKPSMNYQLGVAGTFISGNMPMQIAYDGGGLVVQLWGSNGYQGFALPLVLNAGVWNHFAFSKSQAGTVMVSLNGTSYTLGNFTGNLNSSTLGSLVFGRASNSSWPNPFKGTIDDIAIWNRALTPQEVNALYNAVNNNVNCASNTAITPQTNSLSLGNSATFTATTSDTNPSYVWQSDFGQGYVTLSNYGIYSGVNSATLNIANVQFLQHNQPIRVISTSGNCVDTSNVAVINILDTCITNITINDTITIQVFDTTYVTQTVYDTLQVTIYDTLLTTVTDTLIINSVITGINPPNNLNTLKVFPNPASTHVTIDYGNFNSMNGYTLTIVNSIGQLVFTTLINQQSSYVDLSTWTGNGIYFVQLIDPQNTTIENRKIVIQ